MSDEVTSEMEAMLLFRKHKVAPFKHGDWTVGGRQIEPKLLQQMVDKALIVWPPCDGTDNFNSLIINPKFDIGGETTTL